MKTRNGVVLALASCSILAAACSSSSTSTATTTQAATKVAISAGASYVGLGSSIASGYGIAVQSTSCGRSSVDYAQLVAQKLSFDVTDVSCGAAVISNVVDTPQGTNPPQLDAVSADTKLVTVDVGGNDIGLNGTALECGDPATVCMPPANLAQQEAALTGALVRMLDAIKSKAPKATVVMVTYPREFPTTNCPALSLTDQELSMLRSMGQKLEDAQVAAAKQARVILVDPYSVPGDHTVCAGPSEAWTNGYSVPTGQGFAYHPTALGHQEMAKLIEQKIS